MSSAAPPPPSFPALPAERPPHELELELLARWRD